MRASRRSALSSVSSNRTPAPDAGIRPDVVARLVEQARLQRDSAGQPRPRYRVLDRLNDRTRLELSPLTGRSHQLRVHLMAIGHPLLGDDLYAPPPVRSMSTRLMLHAQSLSLLHPTTGVRLTFTADCPF